MPSSIALRISGESALASNVLPAPMPIFAKRAISAFSDGCGRAELQDEIQDVEELERGALLLGRERLDEVDGRRGGGAGLPRNSDSGWTL